MIERIAFICYHTCPLNSPGEGKSGGMNVYVSALAEVLNTIGLAIDIFTRSHDCHNHIEHLNSSTRVIHLEDDSEEQEPSALISSLPIFTKRLIEFIDSEETQYQMIHSHYWLSASIGSELSTYINIPHVTTFHTLAKLKMQSGIGSAEPLERVESEEILIKNSQHIIAFSQNEKDAIVNFYGGDPDNITTLPCGVDLSTFRPMDQQESLKRLGLTDHNVILCVGRLESLKGIDLLINSTSHINSPKPLKVLIAGGDSDIKYRKHYLQSLIETLQLSNVVRFEGRIAHDLLPLYYNAADVCVVPSQYESFGLVALEAMACGTPVVASRVGGLPTIIQHGSTGYLKSWRCPETFANSVEMIIKNPLLQTTMGVKARERAESMSWSSLADNIFNVYNDMLVVNPTRNI